MPSLTFFVFLFFAYFIGAIPFGLLFGKIFAGKDVRQAGSGNIGATNVNRVLGKKLGAATLLCDFLKAVLPVTLANLFLGSLFLSSLVGLAVVIGHCYPIYLGFKGGKGVATAFGMTAALAPGTALLSLVIWLLVFRFSRISALGALYASAIIPFGAFFEVAVWRNILWIEQISISVVFITLVALIVVRHKENIRRIREGRELKV